MSHVMLKKETKSLFENKSQRKNQPLIAHDQDSCQSNEKSTRIDGKVGELLEDQHMRDSELR